MQQLQKLIDICMAVALNSDYDHVLEEILNAAMDISHCDAGTLYVAEGDFLTFALMKNRSREDLNGHHPKMPPIPLDSKQHMSTLALSQGVIRVEDAYSCKEYDLQGTISFDRSTGYHTKSVLMVPILTRDGSKIGVLQLINCLDLDSGEVCIFSEEDIQITEALASQVSVVLQNAHSQNQLKMLQKSISELQQAKEIPENVKSGLAEYLSSNFSSTVSGQLSSYLGRTVMETASRLNTYTNSLTESVQTLDLLQEAVWKSGISNAELSRRASMNKGTFSNIVNGKRSITKENLLPICIALRLGLAETEKMLAVSGYVFRKSDQRDLVIQYFLKLNETAEHPYWVDDVNDILYEMGLVPLGNQMKNG